MCVRVLMHVGQMRGRPMRGLMRGRPRGGVGVVGLMVGRPGGWKVGLVGQMVGRPGGWQVGLVGGGEWGVGAGGR